MKAAASGIDERPRSAACGPSCSGRPASCSAAWSRHWGLCCARIHDADPLILDVPTPHGSAIALT
jgi:hypothetical protein